MPPTLVVNGERIPVRALRFNPERSADGAEGTPPTRSAAKRGSPAVWVVQPDNQLRKVDVKLGVTYNSLFAYIAAPEILRFIQGSG